MKASTRATAKYQDRVYDKGSIRLKKGTFDRIRATGAESINGYIAAAVMERLERDENRKATESPVESPEE